MGGRRLYSTEDWYYVYGGFRFQQRRYSASGLLLLSPDSDERTSYRPAGRPTGIWILIRTTIYLNYANYPLRSVSDTDSRVRFGGPGLGVPNAKPSQCEICVRSVADQKPQAVLFRRSPSGPTWATRFESSGCRFADRAETNERGLWLLPSFRKPGPHMQAYNHNIQDTHTYAGLPWSIDHAYVRV